MDEPHEMSAYQEWERAKLDDIDHDTDKIIECLMEEKKMGEGFDMGMLAGMMGNKGIDPGIVAMLNDCKRDGSWGEGGGMLILLFLIILLGGRNGFNGWGNGDGAGVAGGIDRTVVNEANYSRLLDAIGTQGTRQEMAIQGLANTLNCDVQAIQTAICGVDKQLALSNRSIENAIQSCCCNLQGKIQDCCCQTNLNIERTGNDIQQKLQENNFAMSNFFAAQTQLISQKFCDQDALIREKFCDLEMRELQNRIHTLEDQLSKQTVDAQTALLLNAINGTKCINARYDSDDQRVRGVVGTNPCGF